MSQRCRCKEQGVEQQGKGGGPGADGGKVTNMGTLLAFARFFSASWYIFSVFCMAAMDDEDVGGKCAGDGGVSGG